uniref:Uncharacterized protein n=1 Tax=Anguilla anguilla TaxID=7936 RepID=A0A0E9PY99_ANGAN
MLKRRALPQRGLTFEGSSQGRAISVSGFNSHLNLTRFRPKRTGHI